MSKRKAAGKSGRGSSWMLLAGALVVLALGAVGWLLLGEADAVPVEVERGTVVPVADPATEALPMVVPEGGEGEVSPLEVDAGSTRPRSQAPVARSTVATRSVSGQLLRFADGSAITDAQLSADGSVGVRTDPEDGRFTVAVAEGDLDLQLTLGKRRAVVKLPAATGDLEDLELVVDTGWILPGVVRGVGGEPVAGALVEGPGSSTMADTAGRFRLLDVRPSSVSPGVKIRASAPMYESGETSVPLPRSLRVLPDVMIQLRGAGALEGWVKPPAGGALAPGTHVRMVLSVVGRNVHFASRQLEAEVGEDGHYRLDGIPAGRHLVLVGTPAKRADMRFVSSVFFSDQGSSEESSVDDDFGAPALWVPDVDIREGEMTRLDATLVAGAVVAGRVTDAAGNPLAGALVEAVREQVWDGVRGQGAKERSSTPLVLSVGARSPGEVILSAPVGQAHTDSSGDYSLAQLPPGGVVLSASHAAHPGWRPTERTLVLASGVRTTSVDLRLGEGLRVLGQVFDAQGQPAAEARVAVLEKKDALIAAKKQLNGQVARMSDGIVVGDDGRFDLAGLPSGPLTLVVTMPGHQSVFRDVSPSLSVIRVDLELAAVFRGRVLDARSGEPVTSFHVLLRGQGMTMANQLSPDDGRFTMDGLKQKEYRLEVKSTGYRKAVLNDVLPDFGNVEREILLVPVN